MLVLKMQIFQIFIPKTLIFSTLGNLRGTHPPKEVEAPSPAGLLSTTQIIVRETVTKWHGLTWIC